MSIRLLTEDGSYLISESVAGITGGSSLNDTAVSMLVKETFETTPLTRGWLAGINWSYDVGNKNMKPI